jgi:hypothetical protein
VTRFGADECHADASGDGLEHPRHGQLVCVRGRLGHYNGVLQVTVGSWERPADANEELLHWLDATTWAQQNTAKS